MRTKTQSIMFAVSAALCVVATPAIARGPSEVPSVAPKANGGGAISAQKRICREAEPLTGSRIKRTECRTRAEWEADGFTVTTRAKAKSARN